MKKILVFISLFFAAAALQACGNAAASISDVKLCASPDEEGICQSDSTSFKTTDSVIYLSSTVNDAPERLRLTATWRYLSGELGNEPQDIDAVSAEAQESGTQPFRSSLGGPEEGWPTGEYEVVLTLSTEDSEPVTRQFSITE